MGFLLCMLAFCQGNDQQKSESVITAPEHKMSAVWCLTHSDSLSQVRHTKDQQEKSNMRDLWQI